ncbi:transposase [uncultured Gimesia sp.]|uniref:transposase n=1 Tax=uncultured Gimesia sp. TaxID=1678688 RepID=UPI0030D9C9A8|tara:strand:+ start:36376 stop:36855 length:480 start_codon:yes stop_codon:yes gene_type:complete
MNEPFTYFITWTTYGTWLQGDRRGWRKTNKGNQLPQPFLEKWCQNQMKEQSVQLNENQRNKVEQVCHQHAQIRGWLIHAISVRSNHVHIVVTANAPPKKVRDQFKAYATRVLREGANPLINNKIWTRGGDIEFIDDVEDNLERVILYIDEAQDRKGRDL